MPATDGRYDAPAYCMICNRPIPIGPTCDDCDRQPCPDGEHSFVIEETNDGREFAVCEECGEEVDVSSHRGRRAREHHIFEEGLR